MWRHGDVLIQAVPKIPQQSRQRQTSILVRGEITGHSHRIELPERAEVWEYNGELFLRVVAASVRVVHEEHKPIVLPQGTYRVWQQREYTPAEIRRVVD